MYASEAIQADKRAYGNWELKWAPKSQPDPVADKRVVSEIGEAWSPKIAPDKTAAITGIIKFISIAAATEPAIGSKIPNDPHDVPVAKAMKLATMNITTGMKFGLMFADVMTEAK